MQQLRRRPGPRAGWMTYYLRRPGGKAVSVDEPPPTPRQGNERWLPWQDEVVLLGRGTDREKAEKLGRSVAAVRARRAKLWREPELRRERG